MSKSLVAVAFLVLNFWIYTRFASEAVIPERESFDRFPDTIGSWVCPQREQMDEKTMGFLGATDYLLCDFRSSEEPTPVNVYVGYHATQVREGTGSNSVNAIHPPEHCLPGSGWDIIESRVVPVDLPGLPGGVGLGADAPEAKRFVVAKGKARQLVYFWYQTQGRVIARNTDVLFYRFWGRATQNRTDGSLVRLTVPITEGNLEAAEARLHGFAAEFVPMLSGYLPL